MNTPISEMALYSGLRWATIEMAQPTAIPANKMKSKPSMLIFSVISFQKRQAHFLKTQN
jgi:hypothetical protein